MSEQVLDCVGVPTFYMNVAVAEDAGGGNVRILNCERRGGVLVPVCEMIIPAADLLVAAGVVTDTALQIFKLAQTGDALHYH